MFGKKIASSAAPLTAATVFVVAGGLISAVNSAAPFDRGSWLAAYFVLVGGVAQAALAYGRLAIGAPALSRSASIRLLGLWNFGSLAVPVGVLAGIGLIIGAGSIALLAAIWLVAGDIRVSTGNASWLSTAYVGLAAMLAVSVAIGCLLADAPLL